MRKEYYVRVKPCPAKCHCSRSGWSLTFLSVSEQTPPLPPHHRPSLLFVCPLSVLQEERPSPHCPSATRQVAWDAMKTKEKKKKRDVPVGSAPKHLSKPQHQLPSIKERVWPEWSGRWLKRIGWRTPGRGLSLFVRQQGGAESTAGCRCWGAWTCGPRSGWNEPSPRGWGWSWVWDRRRAHQVCTKVQVRTSSTRRETGRCLPGRPRSMSYPSHPSQICPLWGNITDRSTATTIKHLRLATKRFKALIKSGCIKMEMDACDFMLNGKTENIKQRKTLKRMVKARRT